MDKINIYTCNDGHRTITENLIGGPTPLFILCRENGCTKKAVSQQYHVDQNQVADWEFYKIDLVESKAQMREMLKQHDINRKSYEQAMISLNAKFKRGELLLRKKESL